MIPPHTCVKIGRHADVYTVVDSVHMYFVGCCCMLVCIVVYMHLDIISCRSVKQTNHTPPSPPPHKICTLLLPCALLHLFGLVTYSNHACNFENVLIRTIHQIHL